MEKHVVDNDLLNWKSDRQVLLDIKEGKSKISFLKDILDVKKEINLQKIIL